ncbi:hypothetical protein UPYG_G00234540 [Umbra pygmaea]|uniref:Uncharacterized protein n=1 Tax=Umbra pygmaea TaxID=75934 RepID=A0ABD0WJC8_UMBPY
MERPNTSVATRKVFGSGLDVMTLGFFSPHVMRESEHFIGWPVVMGVPAAPLSTSEALQLLLLVSRKSAKWSDASSSCPGDRSSGPGIDGLSMGGSQWPSYSSILR